VMNNLEFCAVLCHTHVIDKSVAVRCQPARLLLQIPCSRSSTGSHTAHTTHATHTAQAALSHITQLPLLAADPLGSPGCPSRVNTSRVDDVNVQRIRPHLTLHVQSVLQEESSGAAESSAGSGPHPTPLAATHHPGARCQTHHQTAPSGRQPAYEQGGLGNESG
jgi:hypothetical protein